MQAHQTIGIIEGDFSDRGTARVRQVGVTVVDGQSAETCKTVQRIKFTLISSNNYCYNCCNYCYKLLKLLLNGIISALLLCL